LYITPPVNKFFGPSLKSTYFPIDVILWNNPLSGVDVYAFDFDLTWPCDPYLTFVNATYHSPYANSFVIANGNLTQCPTGPHAGQPADWHLSITAVPPSTGLTSVSKSVLTIWFHIDQEVCYPDIITGNFTLTNVKMSGDGTVPVPITAFEIDNGNYTFSAPQPNIELSTTDAAYNAKTNTITEKCVSHTFDIEVDLTNVTNVYGFTFTLTWNVSYLETDAQHITYKAAFPPPYETLIVSIGTGTLTITLIRPSEKPTVQADFVLPAVDIVFHTIDLVYNPPNNLPTPFNSTIAITDASILVKCPSVVSYNMGGLLLVGAPINYAFKPSPYDLNEDCVVDVQDLMVLLPYYGQTHLGGFGSIYADAAGLVDIFDFVQIAKHFGPVDP
jgi:hypothetical protein